MASPPEPGVSRLLPLPGGRRRGARTGGEATSCFHLLLPPHSDPTRLETPEPPWSFPSLAAHSPLLYSPSLARHRVSSPTPIAVPAATATASPLQAVHELRLIYLFLLDDPPGLGRAASSPPSPNPSPATKAPRRSIRH